MLLDSAAGIWFWRCCYRGAGGGRGRCGRGKEGVDGGCRSVCTCRADMVDPRPGHASRAFAYMR
jgi:hypothetical protein